MEMESVLSPIEYGRKEKMAENFEVGQNRRVRGGYGKVGRE
jgi:hypothetical protein